VRAAERAQQLLAVEEAVLLYERALQVLELRVPVDDARRCDLLIGLGGAQRAAGRREDALRTLRAAADAARRLGRGDLLARVATNWPPTLGRQMVIWNAEYRPLVEEALGCVDEDALADRALLTSALVLTPPDSDSMERRALLSAEAEQLGRRSGDDGALFRALEARLWALTGPDSIEARLRAATEMVAVAERAGSKAMVFEAREQRVRSLVAVGRLAEADLEVETCAELAEALRLPTYRLSVGRFRFMRAIGEGRLADAEALRDECQHWSERIDDPDIELMRVTWTMWLLQTRGELARLEPLFEPFIERSISWVGPSAGLFVAYFYALLEDFEATRRHLAAVSIADLPRDEDWIMATALAAEICADVEDAEVAALLYEQLLPFAETNVTHLHMRHYLGAGSHFVARLAALVGRDDEASGHFEHALAMNQALAARPALARTRYEYGRWLRRGSPRGRAAQRGAELLESAGELARQIGMQELLAKVERALG
jgi:tetratricopeptide (TPR) repeat protein